MEKGTRVVVTKGRKAVGVTGTVFWTGPDQYSDGLRVGVRGDDGETYWLNGEYLEALDPEDTRAAVEPAETFEKGDRVSWEAGGETLEGEVFWIGENKFGPGQRLGVRDAGGEAHWLDAVRVTRV